MHRECADPCRERCAVIRPRPVVRHSGYPPLAGGESPSHRNNAVLTLDNPHSLLPIDRRTVPAMHLSNV